MAQVVTEVSAVVAPEREQELLAAYRALGSEPFPDGLVRTELLRGQEGRWRVLTLWRDREALARMQQAGGTPAAKRLFLEVGADPVLAVLAVADRHSPGG